jgi:hypothetical protein
MKTEELEKIIKPLEPCGEGIDLLLKYKTVAEWFQKCERINHVMYLWLAVACADTDDVFADELLTWLAKRTCDEHPWTYSIDEIHKIRQGAAFNDYMDTAAHGLDSMDEHDRYCNDEPPKHFNAFINTFRCPTDAELRKIKKWTDSWDDD